MLSRSLAVFAALLAIAACDPPTTTTAPPVPEPAPESQPAPDPAPEPEPLPEPDSAPSEAKIPGPRHGGPEIPGPCVPWPQTWLGDWGTAAGLDISCGGMSGACTVTRTPRQVLFSLQAPNTMREGGGPATAACLKQGQSIFGAAFFVDRWPGDAVRLTGASTLSRDENHTESRGHTYVRLADTPTTATLPAWAIGDFVIGDGTETLMTGENGLWTIVGAGRRMHHQGRMGPAPSKKADCVGMGEPWSVGGPVGELCRSGGALTFQQTAPTAATLSLKPVVP